MLVSCGLVITSNQDSTVSQQNDDCVLEVFSQKNDANVESQTDE